MQGKSRQGIFRYLIFSLLMVLVLGQMNFVLSNYTVSPNYAKSTSSQYTFSFTAYNSALGRMNVVAIYPNNFILSSLTGCQVKIQLANLSGIQCTLDATTNQISITNITISTVFSNIQIKFYTATSKYSGTSTVELDFYNATTSSLITINRELVQIDNAIMNCALNSNTTMVGAAAVYTVQYMPAVPIEAGSIIKLQFDSWGPYARSNFLTSSVATVCGSLCTISLMASFQLEILVFSSLYPSSSTSLNSITLNSARNPASMAPIKLMIIVSASDGSSVYMTGSTTLSASTTNTFNGVTFDISNKNISATNANINLRITPKEPINWNTYLRIIYSSYVSTAYTYAFNSLSSFPSQISGQPSNQMLIGNLTRNTTTSEPTLLSMGNFTIVTPPFAQKPVTITFRSEQMINSTLYFVDETTLQIVANPSTITQANAKAQVTTIGSVTSYDLWFVTVNKLIAGSFINITFPVQTQLNSTTSICSLVSPSISSLCSVTSFSTIKISLLQVVNAGTNLTFTVSKVRNSFLTSPTSSFAIKTYYFDDQSLVDQLTSGLTVTSSEAILKSVILSLSSYTVYAKAIYTFAIQPTYSLPSLSTIKIKFPPQISQGGQFLQSFQINGVLAANCSVSSFNNTYMELSSSCISSVVSNSSTITIKIGNVTNPTSFKPTQSFAIDVFNGIYRQEYSASGITVTMNQMAAVSSFKLTPNSYVANDNTLYTFEINFQTKRFSGDRVILKFPSDILISQTFDCASLTTNMTISCSQTDATTVIFILNFISTIYPAQNIKFTFGNVTNLWYATTRNFTMQSTTNDTIYYYQEQGSAVVNYQAAKLSATINKDNNIVLLGVSKLTIGLSSAYQLNRTTNYSPFYFVVIVPDQLTPITNSCLLSNSSSVCTQVSSQVYNITAVGDVSSTFTMKLSAQTGYFDNSSTFNIKLYYGAYLVQQNSMLIAQRFCQSPCKQCTTLSTSCLSCLPSPYVAETIYFSFNNTCVTACPDTYYLNSTDKTCVKCSSTCQNCNNFPTECISCPINKLLLNKTCLSLCPSGYYAYNSECHPCLSPCATCTGQANTCSSCISGFFLDNGGNSTYCVTACTNSNYIGLDGQCKQCTSNCLTCSLSLSNCTTCDQTLYHFYQNTCVSNCPVGMYSSPNGFCVNCVSPCMTCTAQTTCQSCVSNYFLFNNTTCVTSCPNGYIEMVSYCMACDSKCATCGVTVTNCTSCPSGSYFYQNGCYTTCPALTYPYNKTCTKCITPCVTCSSLPDLCLSCIDNLLLLNATCVTACPVSGYIQQGKVCSKCPQNCLTCQSSVNCTLCSNDFNLLQGSCMNPCPVNYPIVSNRQCQQCSDVCLTCDTSKDNCTSCKINYFKYLYTCVVSCPLGYHSNVYTSECEDGLSSKIVFFPILIMSIIILLIVIVTKIITFQTSFPTALTSLLSLAELAIWIYMIVELAQPIKELSVDYSLPIAMNAIALGCLVIQNAGFFYWELKKMEKDDYVRGWGTNNVNYTVLTIHRYVGLIVSFKFFRFCYSRFFNIRTLSLPFRNRENIFPLTTLFSIINIVLCQVPMIICSFSLIYKKLLKDQIFYTSIECLVITIGCLVILLIDIFKSQDFFQESDYVKTRKYLQKIKDASFNQLEDNFDMSKDEGSIDAEKFVSKAGGKFVFSKQDPSSLKQLYFQEQQEVGSTITDGLETIQTKGQTTGQNKRDSARQQKGDSGRKSIGDSGRKGNRGQGTSRNSSRNKSSKRINIFDPIKQQDQQIYQNIKHPQSETKTQLQIQSEKVTSTNQHRQQDDAIPYNQQKLKRLMQFGVNTDECNWDQSRSMIEERPLKEKWNSIILHRETIADSIFNTLEEYSTKQLQKIIEPILEDDYEEEQKREYNREGEKERHYNHGEEKEGEFRLTEYSKVKKPKKKRRRQHQPQQGGNNELEKIYLQRLTEKKKYKDVYASSQSIKYDF